MTNLRIDWRLLVLPPLAAWLGACGADSDANMESVQSMAGAGASAAVAGASSAGRGPAAGGGGAVSIPGSAGQVGARAGAGGAAPAGQSGSAGTAGSSQPRPAGSGGAGGSSPGGGGSSAGTGAGAGGAGAGGAAGHSGSSGQHAAAGSGGAAGSAGAGGAPAMGATFSEVYGVIMAGCSCHGSGAGGLTMSSRATAYANLVGITSSFCSSEKRVVAGVPERSVLLHALEHTSLTGCNVPRMPPGGTKLSATQIATVRSWIAAGARDN